MSDSMRNTLNCAALGAHCLLLFIAHQNDAIKIKARGERKTQFDFSNRK